MLVLRSSLRWQFASRLLVVLAIPWIALLPGVVATAWGQPANTPDAPYSISLRIVDGRAQDLVHAQYRPGQQLRLAAEIRDSSGRTTVGTPASPCTPDYKFVPPEPNPYVWRDPVERDVIHFGNTPGVFSVFAYCRENDQITSEGRNNGPYNFETTNNIFAPQVGPPIVAPPIVAPVPSAQAPAQPKKATSNGTVGGALLLGGLAVGGGIYLAKQLGSNDGDCSCSCSDGTTCTAGSNDCGVSGGVAIPCGCPVAGDSFGCDGRGGKARLAPASPTIHDVIAVGFASKRADECRSPVVGPRSFELAQAKQLAIDSRDAVRPPSHKLAPHLVHPVTDVVTRGVAHGPRVSPLIATPKHGPRVSPLIATPKHAPRVSPLIATPKHGTYVAAGSPTVTADQTKPKITAADVGAAITIAIMTYRWISWLRDRRQEEQRRPPSVQLLPWVQPDAGGVNVSGHF